MESKPKLIRQIRSVSTCAEKLSSLITRSDAAAPSVRLRVLVSICASSSVAIRRGCRASCSRLAERCLVSIIF